MTATLSFKCESYHCEPCSLKQGTLVRELVRMIPKSVVAFEKLIGDEYYCCPICFEPKFTVKGRRRVNGTKSGEKAKMATDPRSGSPGKGPRLISG